METCAERLKHYSQKCVQHLSRVRLSHVLALERLRRDGPSPTDYIDKLISASFGDSLNEDAGRTKLEKVIHELHLLALKANFELYLDRVLTTLWRFHFTKLASNIRDKEMKLSELAGAIAEHSNADFPAKEFVIDEVVPGHGLTQFAVAFKRKPLEVVLSSVLNANDDRLWPQIFTAFEVRHLVEHRDGKVDRDFRKKVTEFWRKTTWGSRENYLQQLKKIQVAEEDVVETYSAMMKAAGLISAKVLDWDSKNAIQDGVGDESRQTDQTSPKATGA